jgi:hypothetical protein
VAVQARAEQSRIADLAGAGAVFGDAGEHHAAVGTRADLIAEAGILSRRAVVRQAQAEVALKSAVGVAATVVVTKRVAAVVRAVPGVVVLAEVAVGLTRLIHAALVVQGAHLALAARRAARLGAATVGLARRQRRITAHRFAGHAAVEQALRLSKAHVAMLVEIALHFELLLQAELVTFVADVADALVVKGNTDERRAGSSHAARAFRRTIFDELPATTELVTFEHACAVADVHAGLADARPARADRGVARFIVATVAEQHGGAAALGAQVHVPVIT